MTRPQAVCAVIALFLLASWSWAADGEKSESGSPATSDNAFADIEKRLTGEPVLVTQSERYADWDARFGWWAMWHSGSPAKVGEYQDLNPSPFWDVDGLSSNGTSTLGITATGNDQETTLGKLHYYQPGVTADVDYERFIHQRDHDPLTNMGQPGDPGKVIAQDFTLGQDYAVRVQELKASFKGDVADGLKVRLDVWGMEKDGTRQVNAVDMCFTQTDAGSPNPPILPPNHPPVTAFSGKCHVLSQPQQIDWITREVKPVVEAHLTDSLVLEYSRPMRGFTANDSTTSRYYNGIGSLTYNASTNPNPYAYAVVPDSYTQMDQLKLSGRLNDDNKVYAFLMAGNTVNEEIDMNRWFNNMDVRLTNTSIENVSLTTYGTIYNEAEQMPSAATVRSVNVSSPVTTTTAPPPTLAQVTSALEQPIDYHKSTAGLKGVWRPGGHGYAYGGLAIAGGYEYCDLDRMNAIYPLATTTLPTSPSGSALDESHTITNSFQVGPDYRWSSCFDTYLHYKFQNAVQPLVGANASTVVGLALPGITNTLLPQHDHIVEMGFNWVPSDWFVFNACIGIERADNHSQYADFDEENYPMSFTAWYAASQKWSLSAGYAVYSNFVAQDIWVADQTPYPSNSLTAPHAATALPPASGRWDYGGQAQVVTLGTRYCLTECVRLTGDVEWVHGHNLITNSPLTGVTLTPPGTAPLGTYSEVLNITTRIRVGVDWTVRPRVVIYGRYELYNFSDVEPGYQTGLAQGILGGFSAIF